MRESARRQRVVKGLGYRANRLIVLLYAGMAWLALGVSRSVSGC